MRFRATLCLSVLLLVLAPTPARAQAREAFVEATVQFMQAAQGEFGDEGRYVITAVDAMARALSDWDAAIGRGETALAADVATAPPSVAARMRASFAALNVERGRFERALAQLDQSIRLDPTFGEAYILKGLVLERLGQAAAAEDAYRSAWQRKSQTLAPAYRVALTPVALSADRSAAAAATDELLAAVMAPGRRQLVFPTDAFLDDTAARAPVLPQAHYREAFLLLTWGRYDEAVTEFRVATSVDPLVRAAAGSPDLLAGATALRAGDAAGAIERLTTVVAVQPELGQAHRLLGLAYRASSDREHALEEFTEAVRLDPGDERARLGLADLLVDAGRAGEARIALGDAVAQLPESGQAHWRLAQLALSAADWPAASASMERAAELGPLAGASALYASLAQLYMQRPDLDATARAYRARVAATPHASAAHFDLGAAYRAAGRVNEALVEFAAAALLDPTSVAAYASAGQVLAAQGRDAEAATLLQRAVTLDPRHREAQYALSRALTRLGRAEEAAGHLRAYEQLQAVAMDKQRRRFENNAETIEELLRRPADGTTGR